MPAFRLRYLRRDKRSVVSVNLRSTCRAQVLGRVFATNSVRGATFGTMSENVWTTTHRRSRPAPGSYSGDAGFTGGRVDLAGEVVLAEGAAGGGALRMVSKKMTWSADRTTYVAERKVLAADNQLVSSREEHVEKFSFGERATKEVLAPGGSQPMTIEWSYIFDDHAKSS